MQALVLEDGILRGEWVMIYCVDRILVFDKLPKLSSAFNKKFIALITMRRHRLHAISA